MIAVLGECVADAFAERPGRWDHRPGTVPARRAESTRAGRRAESVAEHPPVELALRVLPGGGPANTAVALARLGTATRFLGRLSGDVFGSLFRDT